MHPVIIILFCLITAIIHYKYFSIIHNRESRFYKARLLFCIITAGLWGGKIVISSFPISFYSLFMEGRVILRLSRVFLYGLILLTDYGYLRKILIKYRFLLFILCPLLSLAMIEAAIGTDLFTLKLDFVLYNLIALCFMALFYLFFYLLSGSATFALVFCSLCTLMLAIGNSIVYQFRGRYISYTDIYELTAAAAVAKEYHITLHSGSILAIAFFLLSLCIIFLTSENHLKIFSGKILPRIPLCIFTLFISVFLVWSGLIFNHIKTKWDPEETVQQYGYFLAALAEIHDSRTSAPDGYSPDKISDILSSYRTEDSLRSDTPPDIIVIMNESFSDLSVLGDFETNQDPIPNFRNFSDNYQNGYILVSGVGGGTSYTEYEALSGNSQAFIKGAAYARYIHNEVPSLVSTLKSPPNEYLTAGIHPEKPANYYRDRAYRFLGFDKSFFIDAFQDPEKIFNKVTDSADYQFLFRQYEEMSKEGKPVFLFNVTMQNHGDYAHTDYTFDNPVSVTSFDAGSDVDEFLSLTKMSDDALKELTNYFENVDRPVVLLFFGDHQPSLNDHFYEEIFQKSRSDWTEEEELKRHITPFLIWANYDIQKKDYGILSPNQLSPLLLETAGIRLTSFQNYIRSLAATLPVVQSIGYIDRNGQFYTYDEESSYSELISEYRMIQFNYLHDKNHRLDTFYYPE